MDPEKAWGTRVILILLSPTTPSIFSSQQKGSKTNSYSTHFNFKSEYLYLGSGVLQKNGVRHTYGVVWHRERGSSTVHYTTVTRYPPPSAAVRVRHTIVIYLNVVLYQATSMNNSCKRRLVYFPEIFNTTTTTRTTNFRGGVILDGVSFHHGRFVYFHISSVCTYPSYWKEGRCVATVYGRRAGNGIKL